MSSRDEVLMNLALDNYESYDLTEEDSEFFQEKAYYWIRDFVLVGWVVEIYLYCIMTNRIKLLCFNGQILEGILNKSNRKGGW